MRRGLAFASRPLDDRCAGAVAEQDAGAAVIPVGEGAQDVGADDEPRFWICPRADRPESVVAQRVDEARAGAVEIDGPGAFGAELFLQPAGGRGNQRVGRAGGVDNLIDVISGFSGHLERAAGRRAGLNDEFCSFDCRGSTIRRSWMPGALADPISSVVSRRRERSPLVRRADGKALPVPVMQWKRRRKKVWRGRSYSLTRSFLRFFLCREARLPCVRLSFSSERRTRAQQRVLHRSGIAPTMADKHVTCHS